MKRYINLLPPREQKYLRFGRLSHDLRHFGIWILFSLILLAVFLFVGKYFLAKQERLTMEQIMKEKQNLQNFQDLEVKQEVQNFNDDLNNIQTLSTQRVFYSEILQEFASLLPAEITLDSLVITPDGKKVEASGRSETREAVLELRKNLLASKNFININFPLSNLEKSRDVPWSYRFYLRGQKL